MTKSNPNADNKPLIIVTRKLPETIESRMHSLFGERFDIWLNKDDTPFRRDDLMTAVQKANILVPAVTDAITADVIAAAGDSLQMIANFGAGFNHIDLKAAQARHIVVSNTPGHQMVEDSADLTIALILSLLRRLSEGEQNLRSAVWTGWAPTAMLGRRLSGKRLGIVGLGRVGRAVASRARAFGLDIHYHSRNPVPDSVARELDATYWPDLHDMLPKLDVLSVHCPLTPQTQNIIGAVELALLPQTAYVINTARGGIIDEDALAEALRGKNLAGIALDVFEGAPVVNQALLDLDAAVLTPHIASATTEARQEMGELVLVNIQTFVNGHKPPNRVIAAL